MRRACDRRARRTPRRSGRRWQSDSRLLDLVRRNRWQSDSPAESSCRSMFARLVCAPSEFADGYSRRAGRIAVLCAADARRIRIFSGMFLFGYIAATPCRDRRDPTAVACATLPKRCEDLFQRGSSPDDDRAMCRRDRERGRPLQAGGRLPASAARPAPGVPGVRGQVRVIRRHCRTARRGRLDRVRYGPRTACADRVRRHRGAMRCRPGERGRRHTKHCSYLSGCCLLIQVEETWLP